MIESSQSASSSSSRANSTSAFPIQLGHWSNAESDWDNIWQQESSDVSSFYSWDNWNWQPAAAATSAALATQTLLSEDIDRENGTGSDTISPLGDTQYGVPEGTF